MAVLLGDVHGVVDLGLGPSVSFPVLCSSGTDTHRSHRQRSWESEGLHLYRALRMPLMLPKDSKHLTSAVI